MLRLSFGSLILELLALKSHTFTGIVTRVPDALGKDVVNLRLDGVMVTLLVVDR